MTMVEWWWIPAAFGIALVGGALVMTLLNVGSLARYVKISAM
jgi:hypothetical protein